MRRFLSPVELAERRQRISQMIGPIIDVKRFPIRQANEWYQANYRTLSQGKKEKISIDYWKYTDDYTEYMRWVREMFHSAIVICKMTEWYLILDDYTDQTIYALLEGDSHV